MGCVCDDDGADHTSCYSAIFVDLRHVEIIARCGFDRTDTFRVVGDGGESFSIGVVCIFFFVGDSAGGGAICRALEFSCCSIPDHSSLSSRMVSWDMYVFGRVRCVVCLASGAFCPQAAFLGDGCVYPAFSNGTPVVFAVGVSSCASCAK